MKWFQIINEIINSPHFVGGDGNDIFVRTFLSFPLESEVILIRRALEFETLYDPRGVDDVRLGGELIDDRHILRHDLACYGGRQ